MRKVIDLNWDFMAQFRKECKTFPDILYNLNKVKSYAIEPGLSGMEMIISCQNSLSSIEGYIQNLDFHISATKEEINYRKDNNISLDNPDYKPENKEQLEKQLSECNSIQKIQWKGDLTQLVHLLISLTEQGLINDIDEKWQRISDHFIDKKDIEIKPQTLAQTYQNILAQDNKKFLASKKIQKVSSIIDNSKNQEKLDSD